MRIVLILCLCAALVLAAPESNKRITYNYVGETETTTWLKLSPHAQTSSVEKSGFRIKCDVILTILPYEKRQLEMKNVEVEEKSPMDEDFTLSTSLSEMKTALEKHHVEFSDLNGHVTSLKSPPDEPKWVTNVKRGVISALQVHYQENYEKQLTDSKPNIYEYKVSEGDVTGDCMVNYTAKLNDDDLFQVTLTKTKDPKQCTKYTSVVNCTLPGRSCLAMPEKFTSASRTVITMALLESESGIYSNKAIKDVELEEYYLFDHEIDRDSRLVMTSNTTVRQTLKLVTAVPTSSSLAEKPDWPSRTLTAELAAEVKPQTDVDPEQISFPKFDKLMTEYIWEIKHGRYPNIKEPALFMNLVTTLRKSNVSTLLHIYEKYSTADKASRDTFSEVLSSLDTSVAVKLMADQIVSSMVDDSQARRYLRGIAIATNPTSEMVNDVLTIARTKPSLRDQCLLTLGSMIYNFVTNYEVDENAMPDTIEEAKNFLVSFFTKSLKENNEEEILMAIKGLMNTGLSSTLPLMMQCAKDCPTLETRATAIFSPWKVPADKITTKVLNQLSVLFENRTNAIEIRIAAFIMLMELKPSMGIVNRITPTLEAEEDIDMINYICSYLDTSMKTYSLFPGQESRIQTYEEVLRRLGNECPVATQANKFNTSFASSWSLGKEGVLGSHVIYDASSHLPREIKLNFMDMNDVMGFDTHLFEMGLRVEGLGPQLRALKQGIENHRKRGSLRPCRGFDYYLLSMFRRQGIFARRAEVTNVDASGMNGLMCTPEVPSDSICRQEVIKPKLSFYVVILGQEVYFSHKAVDEVAHLLRGLQAGQSVAYNETTQMYYSSFRMPTSLGLPLTARVDKGSRFMISADGDLKVEESQLVAQLNSSFWAFVDGKIGVDGHFISSGLKFNASNGFPHLSVNASVWYDPVKFDMQTSLNEASVYSKRFNFSSFLKRRNGEGEDEMAKNIGFQNLHQSSCVDVTGYADFDGVCRQVNGTSGLNITYQLRATPKGPTNESVRGARETDDEKPIVNEGSNSECVAVSASEWSACRADTQCGRGKQERTLRAWCDQSDDQICRVVETKECQSCSCKGNVEYLTKVHDGMNCQSVQKHLTCPKLCKSSSFRTVDVEFKCTPTEGSQEAGNESAVRLTKTTSIPQSCVCDHEDCERDAPNVNYLI